MYPAFTADMIRELRENEHLDPGDVAAYVDKLTTSERRARIEAHLAQCAECRAEVSDSARIIGTLDARRRRRSGLAAVAAVAAVLLLIVRPGTDRPSDSATSVVHREAPVTTTLAPVALQPRGAVASVPRLVWTSVANADRYEVRVFDAEGNAIFTRETADTSLILSLPTSLRSNASYFWKVEARTGFGRAVASELTEFSVRP